MMAIHETTLLAEAETDERNILNAIKKLEPWKTLVGDKFHVRGPSLDKVQFNDSLRVELLLKEVIENSWIRSKDPNRPKQLRSASISLLFSSKPEIPNATYMVSHHAIGKRHLYLQRISREKYGDTMIYEIIVN